MTDDRAEGTPLPPSAEPDFPRAATATEPPPFSDLRDLVGEALNLIEGYPYRDPRETILGLTARVSEDALLGPGPESVEVLLSLLGTGVWADLNDDRALVRRIRATAEEAERAWADADCDHASHPADGEHGDVTSFIPQRLEQLAGAGPGDDLAGETDAEPDAEGHTPEEWRCPRTLAGVARHVLDVVPAPSGAD
ncbi:hypothetical protein ACIBFB_24115 [Nocardiopsis sp. NPDC050513]|uniref:hypothetical protein n=1 Tax=Nocardiopsis sp. NPDC050513 TaxID=3364338 RepID=UPI0037A705CD